MITLIVGPACRAGARDHAARAGIIADVCPPRAGATNLYRRRLGLRRLGGRGPRFIAEHSHWSLIFWINVPLGFAARC